MRLTNKDGSRKIAIRRMYLTEKETIEKYQENKRECEMYNKLADLEDIEDELGIDLIILYKAVKNGIYFREKLGEKIYEGHLDGIHISFDDKSLVRIYDVKTLHSNVYFAYYKFEDYGKTWALTKEELEDE